MKSINSIENIKEALRKSCVDFKPQYFKKYLFSDLVIEPKKNLFYRYFKLMLCCVKKSSEGEMTVKITTDTENLNIQHYELYDAVHRYPRLTVIVEEVNGFLSIDIPPF